MAELFPDRLNAISTSFSCVLYNIKAVADFYFNFRFTFPKVCLLPAQMSVIILCHFLHLLIFSSLAFFNLYSEMVVFVHGFVFLGELIVGVF